MPAGWGHPAPSGPGSVLCSTPPTSWRAKGCGGFQQGATWLAVVLQLHKRSFGKASGRAGKERRNCGMRSIWARMDHPGSHQGESKGCKPRASHEQPLCNVHATCGEPLAAGHCWAVIQEKKKKEEKRELMRFRGVIKASEGRLG